jgi:hypothetical protein
MRAKSALAFLLIFLAAPRPLSAKDGNNMLLNGDFSAGSSSWWHYKKDTAAYKIAAAKGVLKADIITTGAHPWSVGLGQSGLDLEKDWEYRVAFSAKGSLPKPIKVSLSMASSPYLCHSGAHAFKLTSKMNL